MEILLLSSLEKVFSDEKPKAEEINGFSMLKNERSSFQVAFCCETDADVSVELNGELSSFCKSFLVNEVPVGLPCNKGSDDYYLRKKPGLYPDYLTDLEGEINASAGKWYSVSVEVSPEGKVTGNNVLDLTVKENGKEIKSYSVNIDIIDKELPPQELIYTNWFHCDCLCNYYGCETLSDEFWRICKNFIATAARHGMNCILTPVFTPPLDTAIGGERRTVQLVKVKRRRKNYYFNFDNFRKWVDICLESGIKYFEISHLFTQWGAKHAPKIMATDEKGREKKIFSWSTKTSSREYDSFIRQFAKAFIKEVEALGIRENCFLHVSDEPHGDHLKIYKRRANLISESFPGFKVYDALSEFEFYKKGVLKNPIPCEDRIEEFKGNVPELWTYYCCGQGNSYMPNRFMAMPSLRSRILGFLLYKYDCKGFLQWGYNFYNSQYSYKAINPYEITDACNAFPSGDSFMVYPGEKDEPLESLRLKVFYDGFQDISALRLLESKIGRDNVISVLEEGLDKPLSFSEYPHDEKWFLKTREKINEMIKNS